MVGRLKQQIVCHGFWHVKFENCPYIYAPRRRKFTYLHMLTCLENMCTLGQ